MFGTGLLLIIGGIFFTDLFVPGKNLVATILLTIFSFGILHETFNLFFKSKTKWTLTKKVFFGLSLIVYMTALWELQTLCQSQTILGALFILFSLIVTGLTDTGAYFIGKKFGKKKLAPKISPNKTWAGFWGGLITSSIISTMIMIAVMFSMTTLTTPYIIKSIFIWFAMFVLGSIIVQLGDLFESYIKRLNNFKDSGDIIPGHGGLLDRFDGFLFLMFWISIFLRGVQ